jgi:hypothetical protein
MLAVSVLLALSWQAVPAAEPKEVEEVVVIAKRLRGWQGRFKAADGHFVCTTTRSTGDLDIDAVGCAAGVKCYQRFAPRVQSLTDRKIPRSTRRAMRAALNRDMGVCLTAERRELIGVLGEQRRSR